MGRVSKFTDEQKMEIALELLWRNVCGWWV